MRVSGAAHVGAGRKKMCMRKDCLIGSHRGQEHQSSPSRSDLEVTHWLSSKPWHPWCLWSHGHQEVSLVLPLRRACLLGLSPLVVTWQTMFSSLCPDLKEEPLEVNRTLAREEIVNMAVPLQS